MIDDWLMICLLFSKISFIWYALGTHTCIIHLLVVYWFNNLEYGSQSTLTVFVGVVALRYQHHTTRVDKGHNKHSQSSLAITMNNTPIHVTVVVADNITLGRLVSYLQYNINPHAKCEIASDLCKTVMWLLMVESSLPY